MFFIIYPHLGVLDLLVIGLVFWFFTQKPEPTEHQKLASSREETRDALRAKHEKYKAERGFK
jgi:hypothetical protein